LNPTLKKVLVIFAKNAVNAGLMVIADMVHQPALYNLHTKAGVYGILYSMGKAVAVREAIVWGPPLLKWSTTNAALNGNGDNK
jgi:hypothetical protein